jgi:putative ABC transport system substrate-binding protein
MVEPLIDANRARVLDFVARHRIPAVYTLGGLVRAGGLMGYGPVLLTHFPLAADYVDRILKGAKPADLPVQQSTRFEMVINLKAAKALGLTIPQELILRADEVIR